MARAYLLVFVFLCAASFSDGLFFRIQQGSTRCLWEDLGMGVPATVTYKTRSEKKPAQKNEPHDPDNIAAITVTVRDPWGAQLVRQTGDQNQWNYCHFEALSDGPHEICFTTESPGWFGGWSSEEDTLLEIVVETGESADRYRLKSGSDVDALQQQLNSLTGRTSYIESEQKQLKTRWDSHADIIENTYSRVVFATIVKFIAISALCAWQSRHLKKFFKAKKIID